MMEGLHVIYGRKKSIKRTSVPVNISLHKGTECNLDITENLQKKITFTCKSITFTSKNKCKL